MDPAGNSANGRGIVHDPYVDPSAPNLRRTSSRIARRMNQSAPTSTVQQPARPYPIRAPPAHLSTLQESQHRQTERQRRYYTNFYSRSRTRAVPPSVNRSTPSLIPLATESSVPIAPTALAASTSAPHVATASRPHRHVDSAERFVERDRNLAIFDSHLTMSDWITTTLNNAATQTSSTTTTASPSEINASPEANNQTPSNPPSLVLTPFGDYRQTNRRSGLIPLVPIIRRRNLVDRGQNDASSSSSGSSPSPSNSSTTAATAPVVQSTGSEPGGWRTPRPGLFHNIDLEALNFEALFGIPDGLFNTGLTKQEINRHTISYEYKSSMPVKRKRAKGDEGEASSSATSPTTNDNCSICLDKFNTSVQVRRLPCLHVFHNKCIDKWLKRNKKCPICRIAININYDTLMSSLESGSTIDQCLSQQEASSRPTFAPTITFSLNTRGLSGISFTGSILAATVEYNRDGLHPPPPSGSDSTRTDNV